MAFEHYRALLQWSLSLVYPNLCMVCSLYAQSDDPICETCRPDLPVIENACLRCGQGLLQVGMSQVCGACISAVVPYDRNISAYRYEYPMPSLVRKLKFQKALFLAAALGNFLAEEIAHQHLATGYTLPEVLIPVPISRQRMNERGYNQAQEIALAIRRALKIPVRRLVHRTQHRAPQSSLPKAERKKNVTQAFSVSKRIPYDHVAIVDDVVTTGATVSEIAKLLKHSGVRRVDVFSVCKA